MPRAPGTPNAVLRGIRENERRETRSEFAEAMARTARETGVEVFPDEKYVQRLESGHIIWPHRTYRNILEKLCGRSAHELGFAPTARSGGDSPDVSGGASARINVELREAVWESGMELDQFARKIGVHPKTAERWITQGVIPQSFRRWKASLILGIDESELWPETALSRGLRDDAPSVSGLTKNNLIPASATPEVVTRNDHSEAPLLRSEEEVAEDAIDVLKRIQKIHRSTVHPDIMRHLHENLTQTVAQYENLEHSSLFLALRKQRAWVESLIDECGHPAQRKQLFEISGATSGLLGYVAVGRGDFPLARAYCLEAFQLGGFAGDANLQAWARGLQSFCEYYAGQYYEALILANDGFDYAKSGPQSIRLTINGAARALGKLGDAKGVDRAVDEAYKLMALNDVPDGFPSSISLGCYSAAQTASNAATAYVSLAMPEKVEHYVNLALPEITKSDSPWSRSLVLIDLAVSQVRARDADLEHASTLVQDALTISSGRPVISVQQRTLEFVRDVTNRWGDVRQARMILDATSAAFARGE